MKNIIVRYLFFSLMLVSSSNYSVAFTSDLPDFNSFKVLDQGLLDSFCKALPISRFFLNVGCTKLNFPYFATDSFASYNGSSTLIAGRESISQDGRLAAAVVYSHFRENGIKLVNIESGNDVIQLSDECSKHDENELHSVTFSKNGTEVFVSLYEPDGYHGEAKVWNSSIRVCSVKTGEFIRSISLSLKPQNLSFSADGSTIVAGTQTGRFGVWDANSGEYLRRLEGFSGFNNTIYLRRLILSANGKVAVADGGDATYIWNVETGKLLHTLEAPKNPDGGGNPIDLSADGRWIVRGHSRHYADFIGERCISSGFKHEIAIWDVQSGQKIKNFEESEIHGTNSEQEITYIRFSPNAKALLVILKEFDVDSTVSAAKQVWYQP